MLIDIVYMWTIWVVLKFPSLDLKDSIQGEFYETLIKEPNSLLKSLLLDIQPISPCKINNLKLMNKYQFINESQLYETNEQVLMNLNYRNQNCIINIAKQQILENKQSQSGCIQLISNITVCIIDYNQNKNKNKNKYIFQLTSSSSSENNILFEKQLNQREYQNLRFDISYNNDTSFAIFLNNRIFLQSQSITKCKVENIDFIKLSPDGHYLFAQRANTIQHIRMNPTKCQLIDIKTKVQIQIVTFQPFIYLEKPCLRILDQNGRILNLFVDVEQYTWKPIDQYEIMGIIGIILALISIKINYF